MPKKSSRFAVVYSQNAMTHGVQILVDRKTGVHYLFCKNGYGGGLTPLLDEEGRPVVSPRPPRTGEAEAGAKAGPAPEDGEGGV